MQEGQRVAPQVIVALAQIITGGSASANAPPIGIYRSGPDIVRLFRRNGYEDSYSSWSRVGHTETMLDEIHRMPDGHERIIHLLEDAVNPADYVGQEDKLQAAVDYLNRYLAFDDLDLRFDGKSYRVYSVAGLAPALARAQEAVDELDFGACKKEFDRAVDNVDDDPAAAITAACSLLESISKTMLERLAEPLPADQTVGPLVSSLLKRLRLLPEDQDDQDVRRAIGGLTNVVAGTGALRTKVGSAHGRSDSHVQPGRDLAEFCVNSASTVGLFLLHRYAAEIERQHDGSARQPV